MGNRSQNISEPRELTNRVKKKSRSTKAVASDDWDADSVVEAMQCWAESHGGGDPPSLVDWTPGLARLQGREKAALLFEREGKWPSAARVTQVFGSWNTGIVAAGFVPMKRGFSRSNGEDGKHWTAERILRALDEWVVEVGRAPRICEWIEDVSRAQTDTSEVRRRPRLRRRWPSLGSVVDVFGSWRGMLDARGLELPPLRSEWTREQILDSVKAWVEIFGVPPRFSDWDPDSRRGQVERGVRETAELPGDDGMWPSPSTVAKNFGNFDLAAEAAGFDPAPQLFRGHWTHELIVDAIQRWNETYGAPPTVSDWTPGFLRTKKDHDGLARWEAGYWPIVPVVRRRFGSLNEAIRAAGFTPTDPLLIRAGYDSEQWTPEMVVEAIQRWADAHDGVPPTTRDSHENSKRVLVDAPIEKVRLVLPSTITTTRLYGSWRAAVQAAGFKPLAPGESKRMRAFGPNAWTKKMIVDRIHEWSKENGGRKPTMVQFHRVESQTSAVPSVETINRVFGSWNEALKAAGWERPGRWDVAWTAEQILEAIVEWNQLVGRPPTSTEWSKVRSVSLPGRASAGSELQPWPSAATIADVFGSFRVALDRAGFESAHPSWKTREQVLEALRAWAQKVGRPPHIRELGKPTHFDEDLQVEVPRIPGQKPIRQMFGTLDAACKAAGIGSVRKSNRERITSAVQSWAGEHGRAPLRKEWIQAHATNRNLPSADSIRYLLGDWSTAMRACGLTPTPRPPKKSFWDEQKICEALQKWADEHGHAPSFDDWAQPANPRAIKRTSVPGVRPTSGTVKRIFGSWHNAINAAGLEVYDHRLHRANNRS